MMEWTEEDSIKERISILEDEEARLLRGLRAIRGQLEEERRKLENG